MSTTTSTIKRAQKESLLLREISKLIAQTAYDDVRLQGIIINRVNLSADKSICYIYCYVIGGLPQFEKKLEILKLYKPSLRTAIAKSIKSRYVPDLIFKFDEQYEKEERINKLLDQLKREDNP